MQPSRARTEAPSPLKAAVPSHWRRRQRVKNTVLAHAIVGAGWMWQHIPLAAVRPLGWIFGHLAFLIARRERCIAQKQLHEAFAEWPATRVRRTVRRMFIHLARCALESGRMSTLLDRVTLPPSARDVLDSAYAEGRGVVAITGHLGNWELLAQVVARAGYPVSTIAKPLYDPRLTQWVDTLRSAWGLRVIWRGAASGSKDMLRVFRRGEMLALLIDQDTRVEGVFVPFFGKPAYTPSAAAVLARRFKAPVIVAWCHRQGTATYQLHFERLRYQASEDAGQDVLDLTSAMTSRLENAIVAEPAQWVWLHERWKRQKPT